MSIEEESLISLGAEKKGASNIQPRNTELENATKDLVVRIRKILEAQMRLGTDFNKHPTIALVIVRKNLDKRIQNHPIMKQINMRQLIIYVLIQMGIDVVGGDRPIPVQDQI